MAIRTPLVIGLSGLSAIMTEKGCMCMRCFLGNPAMFALVFQVIQTGTQPVEFFTILIESVLHQEYISGECTKKDK